MKHISFIVACVVCLSVAAWAQEAADYQKWMKDVGATNGALAKDLATKSADAAADALKLSDIFGQVHAFWEKKGGADDAVKFAADAQSGFKQVSDLIAAGKFDDATATIKTTAATCMGCHMVHRERQPDGSFKMK